MAVLLVFVIVLSGGLGVTESQKQTDYLEYDDSSADINDTFPNSPNHSFPLEDKVPPALTDLSGDFSSEANISIWNEVTYGPISNEVEVAENGTSFTDSTVDDFYSSLSNETMEVTSETDYNSTSDYDYESSLNGTDPTTASYGGESSESDNATTVKRSTLFDWQKTTTESNSFSLARATTIRNELNLGRTTQSPGYVPTPRPERTTTLKLFKESLALAVQPFACKSFERLARLSTPEINVYSVEGGDSLNLTCMSKKPHKWVTEAPIFNKGHPEMNVLVGVGSCYDFAPAVVFSFVSRG